MTNMQNDLETLEKELEILRKKYIKANSSAKEAIKPGILDKERRVENLRTEIENTANKIRNTELKQ